VVAGAFKAAIITNIANRLKRGQSFGLYFYQHTDHVRLGYLMTPDWSLRGSVVAGFLLK